VTISAILAYIREDGLDVTLNALHFLVHSSQRVICLVVVEFRNRADGPPSRSGVAVFAGNRQGTVRTSGSLRLRLS
jgi:hypothetical protein